MPTYFLRNFKKHYLGNIFSAYKVVSSLLAFFFLLLWITNVQQAEKTTNNRKYEHTVHLGEMEKRTRTVHRESFLDFVVELNILGIQQ